MFKIVILFIISWNNVFNFIIKGLNRSFKTVLINLSQVSFWKISCQLRNQNQQTYIAALFVWLKYNSHMIFTWNRKLFVCIFIFFKIFFTDWIRSVWWCYTFEINGRWYTERENGNYGYPNCTITNIITYNYK